MRVVIAPDSFKGTATAAQAAAALGAGWRSVRPADDVQLAPMADGGEGTLDAVLGADGQRRAVAVPGPDGRTAHASWGMLPDATGVVELASTSGLSLLSTPLPLVAHTRGFGRAIAAALDAGADRLLLAIGGSASTDGGAGALRELGARFLDRDGREVPDGGAGLRSLDRVDRSALRPPPGGGARVLVDVRNPLLGPDGAAAVYGPQKGASRDDVRRLDEGLGALAARLPVDPSTPGSGAAGGTAFGLLAWGADLVPGAEAVATAIGLPAAIASADVVLVGEGRYDGQTAQGKAPSVVARLAGAAGAPVLLVAGEVAAPVDRFSAAVSLTELVGSTAARTDPERALRAAGALLARRVDAPRAPGPTFRG